MMNGKGGLELLASGLIAHFLLQTLIKEIQHSNYREKESQTQNFSLKRVCLFDKAFDYRGNPSYHRGSEGVTT